MALRLTGPTPQGPPAHLRSRSRSLPAAARPLGWAQAGAPRRQGPWLGPEGPRGFAPAIGCADAALFALRMVNDATTSPCGPFLLGIAYGDTRDKLISAVHPAWTHRGALEYLDRLLDPVEAFPALHDLPGQQLVVRETVLVKGITGHQGV